MKAPAFDYEKPRSLDEAVKLLTGSNGAGKIMLLWVLAGWVRLDAG